MRLVNSRWRGRGTEHVWRVCNSGNQKMAARSLGSNVVVFIGDCAYHAMCLAETPLHEKGCSIDDRVPIELGLRSIV
jgi:hypothetical protein